MAKLAQDKQAFYSIDNPTSWKGVVKQGQQEQTDGVKNQRSAR